MKLLFLDESGDHSLDRIDADYLVFVLGGGVVDRAYYRAVVEPEIARLKRETLGDADVILHTTDIIRARHGFEPLRDERIRSAFYTRLNEVMRALDYRGLACAIRKDEHVERRRPDLDGALDAEWKRLREQGIGPLEPSTLDARIVDLSHKDKRLNLAGLQLADLVVSPIGRHVIGKAPRADWSIVASKLDDLVILT